MDDPFDPLSAPNEPEAVAGEAVPADAELPAEEERYPWDEDPPPDDPDAPRQRHDAFTEAKKSVWLRALVKTGCILDACRLTDISPRTIYRHQENDPIFFEHCRIALRVAGTPAELAAWSRAVEGVEQEFACGGQVHVRRRYSDGLLRLILQGSNPKKYGPNPGFRRKRLLKFERKQMEREIRAELAEKRMTFDEAMVLLDDRLAKADFDGLRARYAPGWTKTEDGHEIPPGYGPIPGWQPPAGSHGEDSTSGDLASGEDAPRDSV